MQTADPAVEFDEVGARWREAMLVGDFEAAWRETDRIELPRRISESCGNISREPHQLVWNGEPFTNKRVLVRCEHGLGDTIMFARYFPMIREQARELIVKIQ